jgi:hypothetical protein
MGRGDPESELNLHRGARIKLITFLIDAVVLQEIDFKSLL